MPAASRASVVLDHHVGKGAVAREPREVGMGQVGVVNQRPGHEEEEGSLLPRVLPDPGDRLLGDALVDQRAVLQGIGLDLAHRLATTAFEQVGDFCDREIEADLLGVGRHVGGKGKAPPSVEPLVRGISARHVAEMPFSEDRGVVTRIGEDLGDRHLPGSQTAGEPRAGRPPGARADRHASRHERGAGRCALDLDVEVREAKALAGEPIEARCGRATQLATPVDPDLSETEIVAQHQDDVGRLLVRACLGRGPRSRGCTDQHGSGEVSSAETPTPHFGEIAHAFLFLLFPSRGVRLLARGSSQSLPDCRAHRRRTSRHYSTPIGSCGPTPHCLL